MNAAISSFFERPQHQMMLLRYSRLTYFVTAAFLVMIVSNRYIGRSVACLISLRTNMVKREDVDNDTSRHHDADGCYHVFVDAGANVGVHARFLFEPEKYPRAHIANGIFDREFGMNRDNRDICAFEIEPNPAHADAHKRNAAAYQAMGWRYHYMPVAASDQNDTVLEFYHQGDANREEWGFSHMPRFKTDKVEKVPSLRLSQWLKDHVQGRLIPTKPYGNNETGPRVVIKMDIEGSEFAVFPDLIASGALCGAVDFMFGEFHKRVFGHDITEYETQRGALLKILQTAKRCKTRFAQLDDEIYLHDGKPLPSISSNAAIHSPNRTMRLV